jgi:hypothetical protein
VSFDKAHAMQAISGLGLQPTNAAIAAHWLSVWNGGALPRRSALSPARMKQYLPRLMLFEVRPGRSVTVKLAGTLFKRMLGVELTGVDWLAAAPDDYREERLQSFDEVAAGALYVGHRELEMTFGPPVRSQELLLPFLPDTPDAAHTVLCHVDWPGDGPVNQVKMTPATTGRPFDITTVILKRLAAGVPA